MAKTGNRGKALKISMVLNVVIMQIFLTLNFLTNFRNRNIELTITYYTVFAVFIVLANFLIYRHYKKEPTTLKW
jgi:amino acid transporter